MLRPFPIDWQSMLVLMPHPDDPEYGMSAAVAKWTTAGKTVRYVMATHGEAGIDGMPPARTVREREAEQRRAAAIVGVADVQLWDFPDSELWLAAAPAAPRFTLCRCLLALLLHNVDFDERE